MVPIEHVVVTGLMGAARRRPGRCSRSASVGGGADSDIDIEASTGKTVRALRDSEGVDAMHRREAAQLLDALGSQEPNVVSAAASVVEDPAACAAMTKPGVAVFWLHASPQVLATRFDSEDEHRPASGPVPAAFLAAQAAHREPLIASIGAHRIDVNGLTRTR